MVSGGGGNDAGAGDGFTTSEIGADVVGASTGAVGVDDATGCPAVLGTPGGATLGGAFD